MADSKPTLEAADFLKSETTDELISILKAKEIPHQKVIDNLNYEKQLRYLQIELVKLQQWVLKENKRAKKFYENLGFEKISESENHYEMKKTGYV